MASFATVLAIVCWSFFVTSVPANALFHGTRFPSFHAIALAAGTDKVTVHSFHHMYDRHLPQFRHTPLTFLEIGLGCGMAYGPGKSMKVWYTYFTNWNATIDFMEYNGACAEKFKDLSTRGKLLVGNQDNAQDLQSVVDRATEIGGYTVIVDDGGHTMSQQLLSFRMLWPVVKPGGVYVIEDLETSYRPDYKGGPIGKPNTTIGFLKSVVDSLNCQHHQDPAAGCIDGLLCMECYKGACILTKNME